MTILISKCSIHVPLKRPKGDKKYIFQKERRVLMRKTTKLSRIILCTPPIISQLLYIEKQISSHLKRKNHEKYVAVSKIKVDPKHWFMYAILYIICKQEIDPLLGQLNNTLTDNKYEMLFIGKPI